MMQILGHGCIFLQVLPDLKGTIAMLIAVNSRVVASGLETLAKPVIFTVRERGDAAFVRTNQRKVHCKECCGIEWEKTLETKPPARMGKNLPGQ